MTDCRTTCGVSTVQTRATPTGTRTDELRIRRKRRTKIVREISGRARAGVRSRRLTVTARCYRDEIRPVILLRRFRQRSPSVYCARLVRGGGRQMTNTRRSALVRSNVLPRQFGRSLLVTAFYPLRVEKYRRLYPPVTYLRGNPNVESTSFDICRTFVTVSTFSLRPVVTGDGKPANVTRKPDDAAGAVGFPTRAGPFTRENVYYGRIAAARCY